MSPLVGEATMFPLVEEFMPSLVVGELCVSLHCMVEELSMAEHMVLEWM